MLAPAWAVTCGLILAMSAAGCGKAQQPWEKVVPAKGVVTYKGKPVAGAIVTLVPQDEEFPESVRPNATSHGNGTFTLGTYSSGDGAPVGEYKAIVLHYPVIGSEDSPHAGPNDLPKKYAAVATTDLRVTVAEDKVELSPLELK